MHDTAIVADRLSVVRGQVRALDNVSFTIAPGKITGLIGPSGSGKTTLMRTIIGAQKITHGSLTVLGRPAGARVLRRSIGYVTQLPAVYSDLTVRQNLQYFAAVTSCPKENIGRVIRQVDLQPQAGQLAASLSGGQLARLSLAVALLGDAQLLVLDEPTVGLDPILRKHLWKLFARLAEEGRTLLVSSHVMDEAEQCPELLLLREGKVISHGSKAVARNDPYQVGRSSIPAFGRKGTDRRNRRHGMSPRLILATAHRVLRQLGHDRRTLGLLFVVPSVLLSLLAWIYSDTPQVFDMIGAPLLGIFPFVVMFLITSIATLRERTSGTLERLLAMPIGKLDLLLGYAVAFGLVAVIQSLVVSFLAIRGLGLDIAGPEWFLVVVALVDAVLGTALGLLVSAFARTEFQAVQFMPAFVLPQFLLCGLLVPLEQLPGVLHAVANCLPLTYAVEAMRHVATEKTVSQDALQAVLTVVAFAFLAVLLGAATLRRRTK